MPDPRFDGSLDAPTFIDRGECVDCGQSSNHRNHHASNEDGHFFNDGVPLLADRPSVHHVDAVEVAKPRIATEPPSITEVAVMPTTDIEEPEDALDDDEQKGDPPDESWSKAVAALREVRYALAWNLCAVALRNAPRAVTSNELQSVINHVHPRQCHSSTVQTTLCRMRKEGIAQSELRDGTDVGGNLRMLAHWSPTPALLESFTETVAGVRSVPRSTQRKRFDDWAARNESPNDADTIAEKIHLKIAWHDEQIRRLEAALEVLNEL